MTRMLVVSAMSAMSAMTIMSASMTAMTAMTAMTSMAGLITIMIHVIHILMMPLGFVMSAMIRFMLIAGFFLAFQVIIFVMVTAA